MPRLDLPSLQCALEQVAAACDYRTRLERDPVAIARRYPHPLERELVGLLAASLAFGNVTSLRAGIETVLQRLGPDSLRISESQANVTRRLRGVGYRMIRDRDIARLLFGARRLQLRHGTMGRAFSTHFRPSGGLREALGGWVHDLRRFSGLGAESGDRGRRGAAHILPDPGGSSACKRLLLFLRWMVRRDDGVDMGLWPDIPPARLIIPVDTHILRLAQNLGLTKGTVPSWGVAEEITEVLRLMDPQDPVRFDFALCHLGMARRCRSRRDHTVCSGCGVRSVCRHWRRSPSRPYVA